MVGAGLYKPRVEHLSLGWKAWRDGDKEDDMSVAKRLPFRRFAVHVAGSRDVDPGRGEAAKQGCRGGNSQRLRIDCRYGHNTKKRQGHGDVCRNLGGNDFGGVGSGVDGIG